MLGITALRMGIMATPQPVRSAVFQIFVNVTSGVTAWMITQRLKHSRKAQAVVAPKRKYKKRKT